MSNSAELWFPGQHSYSPPCVRYIHLKGLLDQPSSCCTTGKQGMISLSSFQCSKSHLFLCIETLTKARPQLREEDGSLGQSHLPWCRVLSGEQCSRGALYLSLHFFFKTRLLISNAHQHQSSSFVLQSYSLNQMQLHRAMLISFFNVQVPYLCNG